MNVRIRYAIPARQAVAAVGTMFALTGILVACGLLLPSAAVAIAVCFAITGLVIWQMVRRIAAVGDAAMNEDALFISPLRWSPCAPGGVIRISWADVERVQQGATANGRGFSILRTAQPKRSWILMPVDTAGPASTANYWFV